MAGRPQQQLQLDLRKDSAIRTPEIARQAPLAVRLAKEAVNRAPDCDLETGLRYERNLFYLLFGTEDQKEGMRAFVDKRKPKFKGG